MDVFAFRDGLVAAYADYVRGFLSIRDQRITAFVEERLQAGDLWPDPLIQLNPAFASGAAIDDLVTEGVLHPECRRIFRRDKERDATSVGQPLRLHQHQTDAIHAARSGHNYVLTTGTGSGKSLAYIVPIVDHVLRRGSGRGIQAIVVYPMNALANSQTGELTKFLQRGYGPGQQPVTFARYTGQEEAAEREAIRAHPPDILLTNYVMLELILTRPDERKLVQAASGLRFLVLDELHTYRGRQGADVALLVRRARDAFAAPNVQIVGTSATLAGAGSFPEQQAEVAAVASTLFGAEVRPEAVIGETLLRATAPLDLTDSIARQALADRVARGGAPPADYQAFVRDPVASWLESAVGVVTEPASGRLVRAEPRALSGADGMASALGDLTGQDRDRCAAALRAVLLGGYEARQPETGFPAFAFRLHQFISRGDAVYTTLESEATRHLTLEGQQFLPGDRQRILLPLVFCRECGQKYYPVWSRLDALSNRRVFSERDLGDLRADDGDGDDGGSGARPGFLHLSVEQPWPTDAEASLDRLPPDWLEERNGVRVVRRDRRPQVPQAVQVGPNGREDDGGLLAHFVPAPFRFCLGCGVEYEPRQGDFAKLATLSSEGRSTATTILSMHAVLGLRADGTLPPHARKLLSFTDNRQDASLQAGHFNDFVEIGLLRGGRVPRRARRRWRRPQPRRAHPTRL